MAEQNKTISTRTGTAVSDARDKTVVVAVESYKTHSKYHKKYRSTKKYKVHDPENATKRGDSVRFVPCKPLSKDKSYKLA